MKLIVTQPFGGYVKGDEIVAAAKIAAALASNPSSVVKVSAADTASSSTTSTKPSA